jgi:hypothetical protein
VLKSGKWRKIGILHFELELTAYIVPTHSHDAARVMKIDNWMKDIWFESRSESGKWDRAWEVHQSYNKEKKRLRCIKMSIYSMLRGLEGSTSEWELKKGSNLVNSQRTHFGFILNGTHTITDWITKVEDHVHKPEQFNWWCIAGVQPNPLCAPLLLLI